MSRPMDQTETRSPEMTLQECQEIDLETFAGDTDPLVMSFVSWGGMCL